MSDTDDNRDVSKLAREVIDELDSGRYGDKFVFSRRQVIALAGAGLSVGALTTLGVDEATAQEAVGQVGTASEPVDVEAATVNAGSVSTESATVTNEVDSGSVNTESATVTNEVDAGSVNTGDATILHPDVNQTTTIDGLINVSGVDDINYSISGTYDKVELEIYNLHAGNEPILMRINNHDGGDYDWTRTDGSDLSGQTEFNLTNGASTFAFVPIRGELTIKYAEANNTSDRRRGVIGPINSARLGDNFHQGFVDDGGDSLDSIQFFVPDPDESITAFILVKGVTNDL